MLTFGGEDDAWGIDMFPFYNEGARLVWYVSFSDMIVEDKSDKCPQPSHHKL